MGIYYRATVLVGLPYEQCLLSSEELESYGFDTVSPYYDASLDRCLFGIIVAATDDYRYTEIDLETIQPLVDDAKKRFVEITGCEGKVYLSPFGT